MTKDIYTANPLMLIAPCSNFSAVTPNDGVQLTISPKALYIGTGGDLTVSSLMEKDVPVTFKNVPSGAIIDVRVSRIYATGTTAADIVAMY